MYDEDYVPKHHPLNLYSRKLESFEDDEKNPDSADSRNNYSYMKIPTSLLRSLRFDHLFNMIKFSALESLKRSPVIANDDMFYFDFIYSTSGRNHSRASFVIVLFTFFSLILCRFFSFAVMCLCLLLVLVLLVCVPTVLILCIKLLIAFDLRQMHSFKDKLRTIALFIQDVNTHSHFGPKITNTPLPKIYLFYQRQICDCISSYINNLINIFLDFHNIRQTNNLDFFNTISVSELLSIQADIRDGNLNSDSNCMKMLRELSLVLSSDFLCELYGIVHSINMGSYGILCNAVISISKWHLRLSKATSDLGDLDAVRRDIIESKQLCLESSDNKTNKTVETAQSRVIHNLLMHLLVSVEHTNNLKELTRTKGELTAPFESNIVDLCNGIEHQLQACMIFWNEFKNFIEPKTQDTLPDCDPTEQTFVYSKNDKNDEQQTKFILPVDPVPVDEVLEDIAVGSGDEDASVVQEDSDLMEVSEPQMPLSFLNELKNVISYRRLAMKEREERALKQRKMGLGCLSSSEESVTDGMPSLPTESFEQAGEVNYKKLGVDEFFSNVHLEQAPSNKCQRPNLKSDLILKQNLYKQMASPMSSQSANIQNDSSHIDKTNNVQVAMLASVLPKASELLAQRRKFGYEMEECFDATGSADELDKEDLYDNH